MPQVPSDRQVFKGALATYWFEGGILVSLSNNVKRTVELIRENVTLVRKITGNTPVPLLIYLAKSPVPDKETRRFSAEQLPVIYSAMAMVSMPGLAALVMKLVFAFRKPPIPIRTFTNDAEAMAWLKTISKRTI